MPMPLRFFFYFPVATIQFNPALYSATEGNSVNFIVELIGGTITRPVSFEFTTVDGSATGKIMTILI